MRCELCFDDCLDLPSLTQIQENQSWNNHRYMGYVILESMNWFDLIWLDIPNLTENNIHYGCRSFALTANIQSTSIFHFISIFGHILDADGLRDFIILHSEYNLVEEGMQSKDRYFIPPNQSIEDIPTDIQHLFICGFENYRDEKLIFSTTLFYHLKSITIGCSCFTNVREFVIDGLESLESVKIGDDCFRSKDLYEISEEDLLSFIPTNGVCRITNCPNLRQLEISHCSFWDFNSFEISNLNSIQSIKFGQWCFKYADFSLKGEWKESKKWNVIWMKMKMMF